MSEGSLATASLIVFRVGALACAVEVDQVREILPRLPTTRIPGAPPVVAGLVNVRGTLVTVVEGWRALGQDPPPPPPVAPLLPDAVAGSTIILELDPAKVDSLPVPLLVRIIRMNDQLVKDFVEKYFNQALKSFLDYQQQVEEQIRRTHGLPWSSKMPSGRRERF